MATQAEQWFSHRHKRQETIALLLSPLFLRRCHLKQVDYAEYVQGRIILWEVKSCWDNSDYARQRALDRAMTSREMKRWSRTKHYLMNLLGVDVEIRVAIIVVRDGFTFVKNHKLY